MLPLTASFQLFSFQLFFRLSAIINQQSSLMKPRLLSTARLSFPLASAIAALLALPAVQAAPLTWDNGAANANWNTTDLNWTSPVTPWSNATPDDAVFGATGVGTVTLTEAITAGSITINTAGYTIDTATFGLTLNTGITANESAIAQSGAGGSIILGANNLWTVAASKTLGVSSAISGTGSSLTKAGAGILTLSGTNTYDGGTTVSAGTLLTTKAAALPLFGTPGSVIVNGGTLGVQVGGSGWSTTAVDTLLANATKTSGALGIDTTNGNLTQWTPFTATNLGALGLTKLGNNTLTLNQANTYSGGTTLNSGTLNINSATALGSGTLTINAGTLDSTALFAAGQPLTTNNAQIWNGNFTFTGTRNLNLGTGTVSLGSTAGSRTVTANANTLTVGGIISDGTATGLTKAGSGNLFLTGANTYTGATTISAGTLSIGSIDVVTNANPLGQSSAAAANLLLGNGATLKFTGAAASTDRSFTINGTAAGNGATLNASGAGAINFTSTAALAYGTAAQTRTLTLTGTNPGNNTLAALIEDNAAATSVTKSGIGTWVLSGLNTYTGPTTTVQSAIPNNGNLIVQFGTLAVTKLANGGSPSSIGQSSNAAANLVINNGTVLKYIGAGDSTDRAFTITGDGSNIQGGTLDASGSGAINWTSTAAITYGNANLTRTLTLTGSSTAANTLKMLLGNNGTTAGAVTLAKAGQGTWVLNSAAVNTYTGGTIVNTGTLIEDFVNLATPTNLINSGSALTLGGGTLSLLGKTDAVSSQSFTGNPTFSSQAGSGISVAGVGTGTMGLTLTNTWTRNAGSTLNVTLGAGGTLTSSPVVANGLVVGSGNIAFATVGGTDWAKVSGGTVIGFSPGDYNPTFPASGATSTVNYSLTDNGSVTTTETANTLKITTNTDGQSLAITTGQTLTLNAGGLLFTGANDYSITGGTLAGSGGTQKDLVVHQFGSGNLTISSALSTSTGLTKTGTGTLILDGANTNTGATFIGGGGTLVLKNQLALQNSVLSINNSGLVFDSSVAANAFTFGGLSASYAGPGYDVALQNNAGSPVPIALTVGGNNGSGNYFGTLSGAGSLIKVGTGTQTLSGINTYTGGTIVTAGTLAGGIAQNDWFLGGSPGAVNVTVQNGATLSLNRNAIAGTLTLNGGIVTNSNGFPSSWDGSIILGAGTTSSISGTVGAFDIPGAISGSGGLARTGSQGSTISGYNTYTGATTVSGGTITLNGTLGAGGGTAITSFATFTQSATGVITGTSSLTVNGGTTSLSGTNTYTGNTRVNGGTLQLTNQVSLYNNGVAATWTKDNFVVGAGAIVNFNVGGAGQFSAANINTLLGLSDSASNGFRAGATVGLDTTGGSLSYGFALANPNSGNNVLGLTKLGPNTLTLEQDNTYTGLTFISAGTLQLGNGSTTGKLSTSSRIVNNGILTINRSDAVAQGVDFSAAPIIGSGAFIQAGAGTTTLNAANTFTGTTTVSAGVLSLTNALALQNSALVTTSGTSTLSGVITLTLGGLSGATGDLGSANVLNGYTGTITALTLNTAVAGPFTYGGVISNGSGTMSLTKTGAGTQILTGANSYTGATIVNAGTLTIGVNGSLNSSSALQISGGTFSYGNTAAGQTVNGLAVGAGNSTVNNTATGQTLALGAITRTASIFGTANFATLTGPISTSTGNTNSIIGPWATTGATTTLRYAVGAGNISALTGTTATANTLANVTDATVNYEYSAAVAGMGAGLSLTGNTLRYSGGALGTAINATSTLTLNGLMQAGTGLLTISGGPTTGGILIGSTGELVIAANAQPTTISAAIGGTGRLVYSGAGSTLLLSSATSNYSGGTVINSGQLRIASDAALGLSSGSITLNGGALLGNNTNPQAGNAGGVTITSARDVIVGVAGGSIGAHGNNNFTTSGKLTGSGPLTMLNVAGAGAQTLNFNSTSNDFTGAIFVPTNSPTISFNSLADSANNIVFNGVQGGTFIWGAGAVVPLVLNSRSFQFSQTASGQTLAITNNNTNASNTITVNTDLLVTVTGSANLALGGTNAGTNTFAGKIPDGPSGSTSVRATSSFWTLTGANTYSGTTGPDNVALTIRGKQALSPYTTISFDPASGSAGGGGGKLNLFMDDAGTVNLGNQVNVRTAQASAAAQWTINVGNNGGLTTGSTLVLGKMNFNSITDYRAAGVTMNVQGANGYRLQFGDVDLNVGQAGAQGFNPTTAPLTITGMVKQVNGKTAANNTAADTLKLDGTNNANLVSGTIMDALDYTDVSNASARPINVTKSNTSVWTLSGSNTYTGATTVSAGMLTIDATGTINNTSGVSIGGGNFNYNSSTALTRPVSFSGTGGTLSGTGTIGTAVNVTTGNSHAPGNSAGIQEFSNSLAYAANSSLQWQLMTNKDNATGTAGTDFDQVSVTGGTFAITTGAKLSLLMAPAVDFSDLFWTSARQWTIANLTSGVTADGGSEVFALDFASIGGTNWSASLASRFAVTRPTDGDGKNDVVLNWLGDPYTIWTQAKGLDGSNNGLSQNPDVDGYTNLVEYAFDTDPLSALSGPGAVEYDAVAQTISKHGQPTITVVKHPDTVEVNAVFGRRKDYAVAGLTYTVQFSADMSVGSWESSAAIPSVLASDATLDVVQVPYPLFLSNGKKAAFFRVEITKN